MLVLFKTDACLVVHFLLLVQKKTNQKKSTPRRKTIIPRWTALSHRTTHMIVRTRRGRWPTHCFTITWCGLVVLKK